MGSDIFLAELAEELALVRNENSELRMENERLKLIEQAYNTLLSELDIVDG